MEKCAGAGCSKPVRWVITVAGGLMQLDPGPSADGVVVLTRRHDGKVRARVLSGTELPAPDDVPAFVPHARTCTASDEARRREGLKRPRCGAGCGYPGWDPWLTENGWTCHVGCAPAARPTPAPPEPAVADQQGALDLEGAAPVLTMTDLFCGAGGSSTGATLVPGVRVVLAANHWPLAVATHNENHPDTDHDCADLSQVDPRRYPRTDIGWFSPECTNHTIAKGLSRRRDQDGTPDLFGETLPEEAAIRSRATMWDVVRFTEHHRYRAVIVENVVDAADWTLWHAWLTAMTALGYDHRVVYANSMHAQAAGEPAPQSRDRLYVVFWRTGERRPDFDRWTRPAAHCSRCDATVQAVQAWKRPDRARGRYRAQYVWRCPNVACRNSVLEPAVLPAAAAIDWTLRGTRIGDRARPLADKTRARIAAGIEKFARPITLEAAGNTFERRAGVRTWPLDDVLRTLHTTASKAVAVPPLLVPVEGRNGKAAATALDPLRTMTTRNETGLLVAPFVAELRGGGSGARELADPLATVTASGNHHALTIAGSWDAWAAVYNYAGRALRDAAAHPLATLTTVDGDALVRGAWPLPDVDDCLLRMLEPYEAGRGMGWSGMGHPGGYVVLGNKREQMRQIGNAVCPPNARDLIHAVAEALTGETVAA